MQPTRARAFSATLSDLSRSRSVNPPELSRSERERVGESERDGGQWQSALTSFPVMFMPESMTLMSGIAPSTSSEASLPKNSSRNSSPVDTTGCKGEGEENGAIR